MRLSFEWYIMCYFLFSNPLCSLCSYLTLVSRCFQILSPLSFSFSITLPRKIVMTRLKKKKKKTASWLRAANISRMYVFAKAEESTHISRISLLTVSSTTRSHRHTVSTLVKTSPQNDQKPILTFLAGTEVGHPFSTLHAFIFYSAQKTPNFSQETPATFSMCHFSSIFISTVS